MSELNKELELAARKVGRVRSEIEVMVAQLTEEEKQRYIDADTIQEKNAVLADLRKRQQENGLSCIHA